MAEDTEVESVSSSIFEGQIRLKNRSTALYGCTAFCSQLNQAFHTCTAERRPTQVSVHLGISLFALLYRTCSESIESNAVLNYERKALYLQWVQEVCVLFILIHFFMFQSHSESVQIILFLSVGQLFPSKASQPP